MGRSRAFETAQVVRAARDVFWREGFDDASMPALRTATGLSTSSLYHAFGSKRGLYDLAVANYIEEIVRPRFAMLQQDPPATQAVVEYLDGLRDALTDPASRVHANGCLLVRAAGSRLSADPQVAQRIADYRAELREALRAGLLARFPDRAQAQTERDASTLTGLVIAAFTLARTDRAGSLDAIDTARSLV